MNPHAFTLKPETKAKIDRAYQLGLQGTGYFTVQVEVTAAGTTKERQRVYLLNEIGEQINLEGERSK